MNTPTARIIDANANRIREGFRVVEEFLRFDLNDADLIAKLKYLRHDLTQHLDQLNTTQLIRARDSEHDVGRHTQTPTEYTRTNTFDIAAASFKRIQEGLRVIEEYAKTTNRDTARAFEQLRYRTYELEQMLVIRLTANRRFANVQLYVIITESLCRHDWVETAQQTLAGGADCLQLREKNLPDRELLDRARTLTRLCRDHNALSIINDRPDIAALADADGVHIGQDDLIVHEVRRIAGPSRLVGLSTHNVAQLHNAIDTSPDYIAVGPMFPSNTKPQDHVPGPTLITDAKNQTTLPIVPIGGINESNLDQLVNAGATRICVCSTIIAAKNPKQATINLKAALTTELENTIPTGTT